MPTIDIRPACLAHASFITANMRDEDKAEIYCQLPAGTKSYEIAAMMLSHGDAFIAYLDDNPVMFFGTHPLNVCTLEAWAMGTKQTRKVLHAATRYVIEHFMPLAVGQGFTGMECRSHVGHAEAHRWIRSTGAVASGEPFVYGKGGEKFVLFRWNVDSLAAAAKRYKVTPCPALSTLSQS